MSCLSGLVQKSKELEELLRERSLRHHHAPFPTWRGASVFHPMSMQKWRSLGNQIRKVFDLGQGLQTWKRLNCGAMRLTNVFLHFLVTLFRYVGCRLLTVPCGERFAQHRLCCEWTCSIWHAKDSIVAAHWRTPGHPEGSRVDWCRTE